MMQQNATRLSLVPIRARQRMLHGTWWPRSYDSEPELSDLITMLRAGMRPATRIGIRRGLWLTMPPTLAVDGQVVRLDWHGPQDIHTISVITEGTRMDLLLVPPGSALGSGYTA